MASRRAGRGTAIQRGSLSVCFLAFCGRSAIHLDGAGWGVRGVRGGRAGCSFCDAPTQIRFVLARKQAQSTSIGGQRSCCRYLPSEGIQITSSPGAGLLDSDGRGQRGKSFDLWLSRLRSPQSRQIDTQATHSRLGVPHHAARPLSSSSFGLCQGFIGPSSAFVAGGVTPNCVFRYYNPRLGASTISTYIRTSPGLGESWLFTFIPPPPDTRRAAPSQAMQGRGPSQEVWRNTVKVERCRYLEASKCKGTCMNLCKLPTEAFFREDLGRDVPGGRTYNRRGERQNTTRRGDAGGGTNQPTTSLVLPPRAVSPLTSLLLRAETESILRALFALHLNRALERPCCLHMYPLSLSSPPLLRWLFVLWQFMTFGEILLFGRETGATTVRRGNICSKL